MNDRSRIRRLEEQLARAKVRVAALEVRVAASEATCARHATILAEHTERIDALYEVVGRNRRGILEPWRG